MGTMINGKKWLGACINGEEVNGLVKNGIVFYCKLNKDFLSSLQIFCKTAGDIGEDRSFCKNGDVLRLFLGTNTLLDHTNYPILNIGGTTKSFNYSYEYLGNYYYGVDINVVEAMNLINDEPVLFSITNIFLANGEQVPNLNNSDITATDVTNVIYDNIAPLVSGVTDEEIYANQSVFPSVTDSHLKSVTLNGESFINGTEISIPGTYNLIATDKARNITDITFELVDDDTPPIIEILSSSLGSQGYYRLLNLKATDNVEIETLKINNQIVNKSGAEIEILDGVDFNFTDGNVLVEAVDIGNNTSQKTITVDKTPPVIDLSNIPSTFEIGVDIYTYPEPGIATDNLDASVNFSSVNIEWHKATEDGQEGELVPPFEWNTTLENREPGDYYISYYIDDKAGNRGEAHRILTLYKTGDITPPVITSLGILNSSNYGNQEAQHYATIGDDVRVLIYFAEMLEVEPTVKMGSKEFTATYREQSSGVGSYAYYADCILSTDMNLPQGEIQIEVYGYADAAGNVGETLTNEDIDNSNYDYVIFDSIAPEYYSLEILNATHYAQGLNANYAGKNDTIRVSVSFPEQLTVSPQLKIGDKVIEGGLVLNQTKSRTTNLYYYSNNVEITDDMNLVDGDPIPIQVYGYEDIAGNVGETLTNIDIKNTEYTEVIYDISAPQTGISGFPLFILASKSSGDNRPYTVIRNGENLFIEVNFNEQLVHNPKISLIRKDGTKTDAIEISYIDMIGERYRYYINITINNSDLGLSEGDQIGFEVTDVEDFAGNTATFDNDDVTSIKLDDGREYGQVTYDNTPPTITVKTDATATVGSIENKVFSKVSFIISDGVGVREWQLNNVTNTLTVSTSNSIDNITSNTTGAIEGTNILKVHDTAGNEATYEFTLTD